MIQQVQTYFMFMLRNDSNSPSELVSDMVTCFCSYSVGNRGVMQRTFAVLQCRNSCCSCNYVRIAADIHTSSIWYSSRQGGGGGTDTMWQAARLPWGVNCTQEETQVLQPDLHRIHFKNRYTEEMFPIQSIFGIGDVLMGRYRPAANFLNVGDHMAEWVRFHASYSGGPGFVFRLGYLYLY